MLLLYCTVNPLILSPVGSGAFSSKDRPGNSTRNGRVHRAGFKTKRAPEWCRSSEPAAQISLWRAPLAEITQNANSFRGTPEQLQVIWHQTGSLSGVVLDWGARDLEFAHCGLIAQGVARLAPSGDGVKYDLY
jgi:hypothetical protein